MLNGLSALYMVEDFRTKRISSYDRSGGNKDCVALESGEKLKIAKIDGSGIIKHIWFTVWTDDPMYRRNIILRMYWDGEENPSVEVPLGDFFGQGWGEHYNFISLPLAGAPKKGRALNCYFPMPFADGAVIEIDNDSTYEIKSFYYYIDYEEHSHIPENAGRFHACWNREITESNGDRENEGEMFGPELKNKTDKQNYMIADIKGNGKFVGLNYYVDNPTPLWYGEGDDMCLIDGEEWPGSLHGTGTEDLLNTSWGPNEQYLHPYFGYARVPEKIGWLGKTHGYRFFIEDPVTFKKSLRFSIEHGHANVLTLDIATVGYWYQSEPHKIYPEIKPRNERQNMPKIDVVEIHKWRDAWRKQHGGGKLWGNEE